jgi:16S rRNA C967 or C1407 C5-methylase (RsmB/RsmF family)
MSAELAREGRTVPQPLDSDNLAAVLGPIAPGRERLAAVAEAIARPAPKAVRLNRLAGVRPDDLGFAVQPVPWLPDWGYWPMQDVQVGQRIEFGAGLYYVQDAGSLLAVGLLEPRPGELICDLCAAPGGKATAILDALGQSGGLLANETIRGRINPLRLNLARQGASRFVVTSLDPENLADLLPAAFDAVLADVPCSGQGLMGSGRQRPSCLDPKIVDYNAARQRRILASAAKLTRPGGRLVYSTCTFSWAENEGQVRQFLDEHANFELAPADGLHPWQSPGPAPRGCYRLWPDHDRAAGAFAARMLRVDHGSTQAEDKAASNRRHAGVARAAIAGKPPWQDWGAWKTPVRFVATDRRRIAAVPADLPDPLQRLFEAGFVAVLPEGAQLFGKTWRPSYALAMRRDKTFAPSRIVMLSDDKARIYLRGQAVSAGIRGWAVVRWKGWPLGWVHGSGRMAGNKIEKAARLLSPR